jgi:hypothetical protein
VRRVVCPVVVGQEPAIAAYRAALQRRGIGTTGWFDRQLRLCLLGAMLQLGWDKAGSPAPELAWWERHTLAGAALL